MTPKPILALLFFFSIAVDPIVADCECGYQTTTGAIYTEAIESDFSTVTDLSQITDWEASRTTYNKTDAPYAIASTPENVFIANGALNLVVSSPNPGENVMYGELRSIRDDILYGTFRAGISTPKTNGTCSAFFFYRNDTAEIDIEMLSRDGGWLVHYEMQPNIFDANGVASPDTYNVTTLSFNSQDDFHEYQFDWQPGKVDMYVGNHPTRSFIAHVPSVNGRIMLNHWSNGDPMWTAGPPTEKAVMLVNYVKAYFNSSDPDIQSERASRCAAAQGKKTSICKIVESKQESNTNEGQQASHSPATWSFRFWPAWSVAVSAVMLIL